MAKVNAAGTGHLEAVFNGIDVQDSELDVAVQAEGKAYVTGEAGSGEATFPVAVGPDVAEGAELASSATTAIAVESTTRRCPLSRIPLPCAQPRPSTIVWPARARCTRGAATGRATRP